MIATKLTKNFLKVGPPKETELYIYDEKLNSRAKDEKFSVNNILKASLPLLKSRYEKVLLQLDKIISYLKENNINHLLFPGKSPHFLFLCLSEIKRILNDPVCCSILNLSSSPFLGGKQDCIDFIKKLRLIAFAFSGRPGAPESNEQYTKVGRDQLFKHFTKTGILEISGKKAAIFDTVGSGLSMRSMMFFLNVFFDDKEKKRPEINIVGLLLDKSKELHYIVKDEKITFKSNKLYGPDSNKFDQILSPNTYPYKVIWFPFPFDYGDCYAPQGSMRPEKWENGPTRGGKHGEWFSKIFLPSYLSEVFSYEPSLLRTMSESIRKVIGKVKFKLANS